MAASSTTMTAVAAYSPTTMAAACISISVSVSSLFFIFIFYFSFFFNFFCLHFDSCKYFSSILMKKFGRHCASLQKKNHKVSCSLLLAIKKYLFRGSIDSSQLSLGKRR
jgi:hypothetical protein